MAGNTVTREQLCLFTRYPQPGTTKTRLIALLGEAGAAELQRQMTVHVIDQIRPLAAKRSVHVAIWYEGGSARQMAQWLGSEFTYTHQETGDIGRRMACAFVQGSVDGFDVVVLIGADIPGISTDILIRAFDRLRQKDLVLGPAEDGGYYLIGLKTKHIEKAVPKLFTKIDWSTDTVLAETIQRAGTMGLNYALVDRLADVDQPDDIRHWETVMADKASH